MVKGPIQGLDNTTLTAEAEYSSKQEKKFWLGLHIYESSSYIFANGVKI